MTTKPNVWSLIKNPVVTNNKKNVHKAIIGIHVEI